MTWWIAGLFSVVPTGQKNGGDWFPGNKLPGYFHKSLRGKKSFLIPNPCRWRDELPGYSQLSLRDKKWGGIGSPAINCRAIFISPYGTENPFLSLIRVDELPGCSQPSLRDRPNPARNIRIRSENPVLIRHQSLIRPSGKNQPLSDFRIFTWHPLCSDLFYSYWFQWTELS